ncbi:hypothetical protein HDU99_005920, partial [Rhizoclosmatium hyalinum]
ESPSRSSAHRSSGSRTKPQSRLLTRLQPAQTTAFQLSSLILRTRTGCAMQNGKRLNGKSGMRLRMNWRQERNARRDWLRFGGRNAKLDSSG